MNIIRNEEDMKQADSTYYYNLTVRYLNGELDSGGEKELFRFVKESPDNERLFRQWEEEWLSSPRLLPVVDKEWKRLQRRRRMQQADENARKRWPLWGRAVAAAVAGLLILTTGWLGMEHYQSLKTAENLFTLETGRAEKTRLLLADGTVVYLNAGSTLSYAGDYNHGHREVCLKGEAYFEVTRQQEDLPFVVKTDFYDVQVKGTKFNVCAYPEDPRVVTTLLKGSVDIVYQNRHIPVRPNELVCLDKHTRQFSREKVQAEQYKSWTEGRFEYDKISLQELVDRLARRYDVTIRLDEAIRKDMVFLISLRNEETIDDILKALTQMTSLTYVKQGRSVYIKKE